MKSVYSAVRTGSLTKVVCASSLHSAIMNLCLVFIWEQTATCATYSKNWLVFITEMKSVYSAIRTGSLNKSACFVFTFCHTEFVCFVFIWEQTATCTTYSINWLVFITEMKSVYSAVRTGSLNKVFCVSSLHSAILNLCLVFIWEQTATCATYSKNWLGFITEMKSVYSVVRTGSLNKGVCASY